MADLPFALPVDSSLFSRGSASVRARQSKLSFSLVACCCQYRMPAPFLEVPSQTATSSPTDFFLPSSTSHQCNDVNTPGSVLKKTILHLNVGLSRCLSFPAFQRSNPSCSSSISLTPSRASAVPVPPVSATDRCGGPPVTSYSPSSASLTTLYPVDQSQVRPPVQSPGCVPEDPGLLPAEAPSSTHSKSSRRSCPPHGRPLRDGSFSPEFGSEEYKGLVEGEPPWPCGEDFLGSRKRKKRGDTSQEGRSSHDDLPNCYGKELNGDNNSNTVCNFKYAATSTRDFGWLNGLPVFASSLRWGWSPVERLLASRIASHGSTTAQKNTLSKTLERKSFPFTAKSEFCEAHHVGQSKDIRSHVEPSAGVEAEKAVLGRMVRSSTGETSQDTGKRGRRSLRGQQEGCLSLSFVNRRSDCFDRSSENMGRSSEEMGKAQAMLYHFSGKKMPSEPPRFRFPRNESNPLTVATMVPIRGCLRLWDPYRGELLTTGVLKSRIANRPVKLRSHQGERRQDSDTSFRVSSSNTMKRRDLLQLLDGSHVPPGLEREISQVRESLSVVARGQHQEAACPVCEEIPVFVTRKLLCLLRIYASRDSDDCCSVLSSYQCIYNVYREPNLIYRSKLSQYFYRSGQRGYTHPGLWAVLRYCRVDRCVSVRFKLLSQFSPVQMTDFFAALQFKSIC